MQPISWLTALKIIFTYFPEFVAFLKRIQGMVSAGMTEHEIREKCKAIDAAFAPGKLPSISARELDDLFRGSK